MMIEELISRIFSTRNHAHIMHWATKSFSEHSALGSFYDSLIDLIDKFVEAYQGNFGQVGEFKPEDYSKNLDEIVGEYLSTRYKLKYLK